MKKYSTLVGGDEISTPRLQAGQHVDLRSFLCYVLECKRPAVTRFFADGTHHMLDFSNPPTSMSKCYQLEVFGAHVPLLSAGIQRGYTTVYRGDSLDEQQLAMLAEALSPGQSPEHIMGIVQPVQEETMQVTDRMVLFPDGNYHGRTAEGREIVVTPSELEGYHIDAQAQEEYPGQAEFWAHDPEVWVYVAGNGSVWYQE